MHTITIRIRHTIAALVVLAALPGCGDTFDTRNLGITTPQENFGDTTYVLQTPVWTGFNRPTDVLVGNEPFIYVADAGNNRIAMLDLSGAIVGYSRSVKNPVAIAQDHRLNLLVCGEIDTVINGQAATYGAIFRIDLYAARHAIARAPVVPVYLEVTNPQRRYTGVAVLADNSYYVTRTGMNNASIVDPDDAVLLFDKADRLRPREYWPALAVDGTGLATITSPTAIATFPKATSDFIFTQNGAKSFFRCQWMTQRTTGDVTQWESFYTPARDGAIDFLRVGLFMDPEDVTIDPDGNVYVVDAELNAMIRFNSSGFISRKITDKLLHPRGVAFFDKTLYIADTGNDRVLRFMLSTDIR